jgi:hypothetical protein
VRRSPEEGTAWQEEAHEVKMQSLAGWWHHLFPLWTCGDSEFKEICPYLMVTRGMDGLYRDLLEVQHFWDTKNETSEHD